MKSFLKAIPIPMCGLVLAILSLGNLLFLYHLDLLGNIVGIIGVIFMAFVLGKIIFLFEHVKHDLKNPVIASTAPTFTMGVMVMCTYFMRWSNGLAIIRYLWLIAVVIHIGLMVYFTYYFLLNDDVTIERIYPSWFVVYCGCGVVPITASNFYPLIGEIIFWIALGFYCLLLPIVIYRVFIHRKFEEHTLPLVTITAAPGSLCLTGYLSGFAKPNFVLVTVLLIISQFLYLLIVLRLPKMMKIDFYPSYAAFTFPLVISATALTKANIFYNGMGYNEVFVRYIAIAETILCSLVVVYVTVHYINFIIKKSREV